LVKTFKQVQPFGKIASHLVLQSLECYCFYTSLEIYRLVRAHPIYLKIIPSRIYLILGVSIKDAWFLVSSYTQKYRTQYVHAKLLSTWISHLKGQP
jgi:hypothetical protein